MSFKASMLLSKGRKIRFFGGAFILTRPLCTSIGSEENLFMEMEEYKLENVVRDVMLYFFLFRQENDVKTCV